jgi:hypothetical protein
MSTGERHAEDAVRYDLRYGHGKRSGLRGKT